MRIVFCFLLCIVFPQISTAQQKIEEFKVSWNLFKAKKPATAKYPAFTSYKFNLKTKLVKVVDNTLKLNFEIIFKLDSSKSYMDANRIGVDVALLNHEQGHADIGVIYARKLSKELAKAVFYKTGYNEKITGIFDQVNKLMLKANANYDEQTKHGTDESEQLRWEKIIDKLLLVE
jgi:predicted secreted Zn-dependent protease